jgi:threonine dehydratase
MAITPLLSFDQFYLKREDQNLTGSAKDRAIPLQLNNLRQQGYSSAVISSTGNAAISALYYCRQQQIPLTIFVSTQIDSAKLNLIRNNLNSNQLIQSSKPITDAFRYAKDHHSYLLRQSTDPVALTGYQTIATELLEQLPQITSLFAPVGSGTTLLGIANSLPSSVKIYAIQPAANPTIASLFDQNYTPEILNPCDALTVKYTPLKNNLLKAIKEHNGSGLVIGSSDLSQSQDSLTRLEIETSNEGILSFAGYQKAISLSLPIGDYPVIILTGQKR